MEEKLFKLVSEYQPTGDQPEAIDALVKGLREGKHEQVLLGATGTGKTFTIANVIQKVNKPTLVFAHNKTLAGQLYSEFKALFPEKDIWLYTGYTFESLQHSPLLSLIDVVVDGMYMEDERDISLAFRGSRNQRIINVPASLEAGVCVLWKQTDAAKQQEE